MIIFGWGHRGHRVKGETFLCPVCGTHQIYWHRWLRKYFHLFFVPLFSLGDDRNLSRIECSGCGSDFDETVLHGHSPAIRALEQGQPASFDPREDLTTTAACPTCGRQNSIHTRVCPRCETRLTTAHENRER